MEQRKAEIAAMKAKLVEIKRRNAERQQSLSMSRRSAEVHTRISHPDFMRMLYSSGLIYSRGGEIAHFSASSVLLQQ